MKRNLVLSILAGCFALALPSVSLAERPWDKLVPFKKLDANPNKAYPLTTENGPWSIMATTFRGEHAETQARELVFELRKVYKLPAYTFKRSYDYSGRVQGLGLNPDGTPKTMRYVQSDHGEEVAVLIGDFSSVDDPKGQRLLRQIKHMKPEALALEKGKGTNQNFAALRRLHARISPNEEDQKKGPMRHAIMTTNPLLPKEYFAPQGLDRLVVQMNDGVKHSLLNCPGKYSVKIATFSGYVVLDQREIARVEAGEVATKSRLEKAAMQAHKLTEALRAQGVEAYEFHDRFESIVTVGGFQTVGNQREDGLIEMNPRIFEIIERYKGQESQAAARIQTSTGESLAAGIQAQRINGIPLDIQPVPVEVPRRSIASDYRQVNYESQ